MEYEMVFKSGTTPGAGTGSYYGTLPIGYTINFSSMITGSTPASVSNFIGQGSGMVNNSGTAAVAVVPLVNGITQGILFKDVTTGTDISATFPSASWWNNSGAGDTIQIKGSVPIAEWSGNGTVNLGPGAQQEFLSTVFTSSIPYRGPDGTVLPSTTPTGTSDTLLISASNPWQYPQQSSDSVRVEVDISGQGKWTECGNTYIDTLRYDGTNYIGLGVLWAAGGFYIIRGKFATGTGATWAGVPGGSRYRIVKANPSSPVGFGLAGTDGSAGLYKPGQAPGYTGGAAIPTGYVGEMFGTLRSGTGGFTYSDQSTTKASGSATQVLSRALNKGVYLLSFSSTIGAGSSIPTVFFADIQVGGTTINQTNQFSVMVDNDEAFRETLSGVIPIVISADNTIVRLLSTEIGQTATPGLQVNEWWIVRIA
jgi:hypothetical protein